MAGLPAFTGSTFRRFMTRPPATAAVHGDEQKYARSTNPSLQTLRPRQTGIREHTDDSCELPKSDAILQHLTESYGGKDAPGVGFGGYDDFNNLDALEATLDQLKEDVSKLREEADIDRITPSDEREGSCKTVSSTAQRGSSPVPVPHKDTSAAAQLQKLHEEADQEKFASQAQSSAEPPQPPPPPSKDFPSLGSPTATSTSKANAPRDARRPSYADAAMSGLKKFSKVAAPPTSLTSQDSAEDDTSVNVSQARAKIAADEHPKSTKHAPHFAQPTQSYARRAGELVRKEAGLSPAKPALELCLSQSVKGKEHHLITAKQSSQRQQKRKSLPGGWMNEDDGNDTSTVTDGAISPIGATPAMERNATHSASPLKHPTRTTAPAVKSETAATKPTSRVAHTQHSPRLQKKTSSYMSPTSATTQRTAATLSKERPKRESQSPKKRLPKLDTSPTKQAAALHSPQITAAGSDTSSVQFILDRPAALIASPTGGVGSPEAQYLEEQQAGRSSPVFGSPNGSPSRLPRKSRMIEHFSSPMGSMDQNASQRSPSPDYGTLYSMPTVGNTRTVRRTSNEMILRPIMARLSAHGLARRDSSNNAQSPISAVENVCYAPRAAKEGPSQSPRTSKEQPAILSRAHSAELLPLNVATHHESQGLSNWHFGMQSDAYPTSPALGEIITPVRAASYSTLRATASEFMPMQQGTRLDEPEYGQAYNVPGAIQHTPLPSHSLKELTAFRTPEEWMRIPVEQKMMINHLRALSNRQRSGYTGGPIWNRRTAPGGHNILPNLGHTTPGNMSVYDTGSPQINQSIGALKWNTVAGKKTVHWTSADTNSAEMPIKFGRAPAPTAPAEQDSPHATISPASDDTSPLRTPRSLPWSIGSASGMTMPYGWTGGDGKEIRFIGYGPHAERDPNSVVNFDFNGRKSSTSNLHSAFHDAVRDENKEDVSGTIAPRSQKQWAEKLGLDRVPCANVVITQATEVITPFWNDVKGWCHDCYGR